MFNHNNINFQTVPALRCDIVDDVTLMPMVGDITGEVSAYALGAVAKQSSLPYTKRMIAKDTPNYQLPPIKPWNISNQEVIYGGIFFMHWGHFLIEDLQRLWYAKNCALPIVWVGVNGATYTPAGFKKWQSDIFQSLGINNEHIFLKEPTQFAKVHFPEPGSGINTHLHPEHAAFLGYYEQAPTAGRFVYFSRSKIRSCSNEEQVENALKKRGWHIVYPETMTVAQQLKALASAEVCFMVGGSAQHTLLLTKNLQTRLIVVPREHGDTFNIVANAKSDNYYLFNLPKKVLYSDSTDEANNFFTLDLGTLEKYLAETEDFTKNLTSPMFEKPEKLEDKHIRVPEWYYEQTPPISYARKLFYHAYFLYEQKKYRKAYNICMHLYKRNLLEDDMYVFFFKIVQMQHVQGGISSVWPLVKHAHHIQSLREKIEKEPKNKDNYKKILKYYLVSGKVNEARDLLEDLRQQNPSWSYALLKIADIYRREKNLDKAIEYAKEAVTAEPQNFKCKRELAGYLLEKRDYGACKTLVAQGLQQNPAWSEGYALMARVHDIQGSQENHNNLGYIDKAIACVQKAIDLEPENQQALEQLAGYLQKKGDNVKAINVLASAMQNNPRGGERHAQNARIYEIIGEFDKAIIHARKAVELEPRNFVCKAHLATYLRKNKSYAELSEVLDEVMHLNPFWSEPHAQYAAMYATEGNLDKAIDCARKAVAAEPYDPLRKAELYDYRTQKLRKKFYSRDGFVRYTTSWMRIQAYIDIVYAKTYLEIGVDHGHTFLNLDVPFKIGVDPEFKFDTQPHANENTVLHQETSDTFFEHFPKRVENLKSVYHNKDFKFDVIFIDGLHTFEQSLRDFENSLAYGHEKTIWIIDDTIPSNHFSAMTSQEQCIRYQKCAGFSLDSAWHGDVFKTVLYIHDNYPEFSYCTQIDSGNPQTIVWRTEKPSERKKLFESKQAIARMRYEDFLEQAWVLYPVEDADVLGKIFSNINPLDYRTNEEYLHVIKPIITDQERVLRAENEKYKEIVEKMRENNKALSDELNKQTRKNTEILKHNAELHTEINLLKKNSSSSE